MSEARNGEHECQSMFIFDGSLSLSRVADGRRRNEPVRRPDSPGRFGSTSVRPEPEMLSGQLHLRCARRGQPVSFHTIRQREPRAT